MHNYSPVLIRLPVTEVAKENNNWIMISISELLSAKDPMDFHFRAKSMDNNFRFREKFPQN